MKFCPQCQTKYTDDTLQFCLQDGATLASELSEASSMETVAFGEFETAESREQETVLAQKNNERLRVDVVAPPSGDFGSSRSFGVATAQAEPKKSRTLLAIIITAGSMLLIFGAGAVGVWFYFNGGSSASRESATNSATETKTDPKNEALKKEVMRRVVEWKSMAEARNLNSYMRFYANKVNYYKKKSLSRNLVRRDKQKAFTSYPKIEITLTNMRIKILEGEESAIAAFDKEWVFTNSKKRLTGQVRTQLVLVKEKDEWLIESEKDLKVYYVNR